MGQHENMICVLFCPKYLGQWDGGTQEKHVQFGCQSILVLHSFCPQMVGGWDSGTAEKTYDLWIVMFQIFGTVGQCDTRKNIYSKVVSLYLCDKAYVPKWWDGGTVGQEENI